MAKVVCVILLMLLGVQYVSANTVPPVEVHVRLDDVLYMYDCYPVDMSGPVEMDMIVYINYPQGIAGYRCDYGGGAWIMPFAQPGNEYATTIQGESE